MTRLLTTMSVVVEVARGATTPARAFTILVGVATAGSVVEAPVDVGVAPAEAVGVTTASDDASSEGVIIAGTADGDTGGTGVPVATGSAETLVAAVGVALDGVAAGEAIADSDGAGSCAQPLSGAPITIKAKTATPEITTRALARVPACTNTVPPPVSRPPGHRCNFGRTYTSGEHLVAQIRQFDQQLRLEHRRVPREFLNVRCNQRQHSAWKEPSWLTPDGRPCNVSGLPGGRPASARRRPTGADRSFGRGASSRRRSGLRDRWTLPARPG